MFSTCPPICACVRPLAETFADRLAVDLVCFEPDFAVVLCVHASLYANCRTNDLRRGGLR